MCYTFSIRLLFTSEHFSGPDSYPVAFWRRAKDCGEDRGKKATFPEFVLPITLCASLISFPKRPPKSDWVRVCFRTAAGLITLSRQEAVVFISGSFYPIRDREKLTFACKVSIKMFGLHFRSQCWTTVIQRDRSLEMSSEMRRNGQGKYNISICTVKQTPWL